jgi:hypothetical protein
VRNVVLHVWIIGSCGCGGDANDDGAGEKLVVFIAYLVIFNLNEC